jgi:hypothetical protein
VKRFIVHWTYCGDSLSVNVTLDRIRNGSNGHADAVYQAVLLVLKAGRAELLDPAYACDVWEATPKGARLYPESFGVCWENNAENGGFLRIAGF